MNGTAMFFVGCCHTEGAEQDWENVVGCGVFGAVVQQEVEAGNQQGQHLRRLLDQKHLLAYKPRQHQVCVARDGMPSFAIAARRCEAYIPRNSLRCMSSAMANMLGNTNATCEHACMGWAWHRHVGLLCKCTYLERVGYLVHEVRKNLGAQHARRNVA